MQQWVEEYCVHHEHSHDIPAIIWKDFVKNFCEQCRENFVGKMRWQVTELVYRTWDDILGGDVISKVESQYSRSKNCAYPFHSSAFTDLDWRCCCCVLCRCVLVWWQFCIDVFFFGELMCFMVMVDIWKALVDFPRAVITFQRISGDLIPRVIVGIQWEPKMGNISGDGYRIGTRTKFTNWKQ